MPRIARIASFVFLAARLATAAPAIPALTVHGDDGQVALAIEALHVEVLVRGHLARTTFEITWRNALDHDVDGELSFPLPADAELSDLGLYFDGRLRHAVAVERVQARAAYEETIHAGVDPALAEWSASTRMFRFRVYPIPARGTKSVRLAYDQELTEGPYELDLRWGRTLASVQVRIDSDVPVDGGALPLRRSGDLWSFRAEETRLDALVRADRSPDETALVAWSAADRLWYVSASLNARVAEVAVEPADHVTLLFDVSSSAVQRDEQVLIDFLSELLVRQGEPAVTIRPFHVELDAPIETSRAGVERTLTDLPRAGATDLVHVLEALPAIAAATPRTRMVIVTDGIDTVGDPARLARAISRLERSTGTRLTIVNASPATDDIVLGALARVSGGWLLDLTRVAVAEAVSAAMRLPARVELIPGQPGIRDVVPSALSITSERRAVVNARSKERLSVVPFIAGHRRDLPVREVESGDLVRRAWARARLRELLAGGAGADLILEHGRRFTQLTPQTSLIVLDTWQDYERYGFPLPSDLRAVREAELAAARALSRPEVSAGAVAVRREIERDPRVSDSRWFLDGTVAAADGSLLPGVTITLAPADGPPSSVVSDGNGRFRVTAPRAPSAFVLRAELSGLGRVSRAWPRGAARGSQVDVIMHFAAVAETITVTAEAPSLEIQSVSSMGRGTSFATPGRLGLADRLLDSLAGGAPPLPRDEEEAGLAIARRLNRVREVVARMRTLTSAADRLRYYVAARSVIGGDRLFQAEAALALREVAPELAVRALTDLAEAWPDDAPTLRLVGRVLDGWGRGDLARMLFERALSLAPRQSQTWRELMLLAAKEDRRDRLDDLLQRYEAAVRDDRMVRSDDALRAELLRHRRGSDPRIDETAELQVEVMWDANWTDVDLHVLEPSGEAVSYRHLRSAAGGELHGDVTSGFGPETYTLPRIAPGRYEIALDYYSGDAVRLSLQTLAHVIVYVRGQRRDFFLTLTGEEERRVVAVVE